MKGPWWGGFRLPVLVALTALAIALRLHRLEEWSLWIDEVLSLERARDLGAVGPTWWTPAYGAMSIAMRSVGEDAWGARLAPALLGALSVPLAYLLFRRFTGVGTSLLAAAFLAVSPWHLLWSQNARPYTILVLVYTGASYLFYEGFRSRRRSWICVATLLLVASIFERRYVLAFAPATFGAWVLLHLWATRGRGSMRVAVTALVVLSIGVVLAWMAWDAVAASTGRTTVLEEIRAYSGRGSRRSPQRMLADVASVATWPLCIFATLAGFEALWRRSASRLFPLAATAAPLAVLLVLTSFARAFERYVLVILPWLTLLAAWWIGDRWQQRKPWARVLATSAAILVLGTSLMGDLDHFDRHGRRAIRRGGIAAIAAGLRPGEIVWFHRPAVARHYLGGKGRHHDLDDLEDPSSLLGPRRRTWVLVPEGRHFDVLRNFLVEHALPIDVSDVPHLPARLFLIDPRSGKPISPPGRGLSPAPR